jgi:hypothetical protein
VGCFAFCGVDSQCLVQHKQCVSVAAASDPVFADCPGLLGSGPCTNQAQEEFLKDVEKQFDLPLERLDGLIVELTQEMEKGLAEVGGGC